MKNNLSKPTIIFHWLTGLAFLIVLCIGLYLDFMPRGPEKGEMIGLHKSIGTLVFVIAVLRLCWRFKEGSITRIAKLTRAQTILATSVHHLLLLATLMMPISGITLSISGGRGLSVFGQQIVAGGGDKIEWLNSIAHTMHTGAVNVILVILFLHIAGAIKHQFIDKDGTLSRMLGNFHK